MAEYCKVCGVQLRPSNMVDYRPGSCRDCELERKKLYSGLAGDFSTARKTIKTKSKLKKGSKKNKQTSKKDRQKERQKLLKQKKEKLLKAKRRFEKLKKLAKFRAQQEKRRKKLRARLERMKKLRAKKLLKLKVLKKKQRLKEKREKEKIKLRIRKAKERERKLLRKEKERIKREKDKLRQLVRLEKERARAEKKSEKDRIRAEKQRIKLEKQQEKERLKKAKEAAKLALVQAKEAARQAAHEAKRLREEAKKPPMVSVVTKVKELQPPPDAKLISATEQRQSKAIQPTKIIDPKKPTSIAGASSSLLQSAKVIPASTGSKEKEAKEILKEVAKGHVSETVQKEVEKLQKDTDPIIDRYNPYAQELSNPSAPRAPSPTPWLTSNFSVVKGDFKETKHDESSATTSGLTDEQVKDIIEKIKSEHKKKSN